ncbi:putative baseplate assembly protein [Actinoplanes subtropicus]|uniref:putative baseplate assembly protein n=1 Tax=Actinoplanes subtropicus TaxID=543632 RepID=UPI0004C2F719|nr:putative baseplate assembly protein [Actinoplanes subtropicus]
MTGEIWWGREAGGEVPPLRPGPSGRQPALVDDRRAAIRDAIRARIPAYTPEWSDPGPADAGSALVEVFAAQAEPVRQRLNRLPEKLLTEQLRIAGLTPLAAAPAEAVLQFTVTPADGASVLVPAGFQAGAASPAPGAGGQIVFETQRDLWATPATLAATLTGTAGRLDPVGGGTFRPFGDHPQPGDALWLGLSGPVAPYPRLTVEIVAQPGGPAPTGLAPLLAWSVLDGGRSLALEVIRDDTAGLRTSGTVELRLPGTWRPGRPPGTRPLPLLRWLRVSLNHGAYATPPALTAVRLNAVPAVAVRTIRDEALLPIPGGPADGRTRMRLSGTPIVPGSAVIEVDDDLAGDPPVAARWREVRSLAGQTGDARVFTVDHATGEVTFGDGVRGAKVPPGFRNVRATAYRVGGGSAGRVAAGAINATVTSLPDVTGVANADPATGGSDPEPVADVLGRGPAELRAGGRAVTAADYAQLALGAPGTLVARAHGVAGLDPGRPAVSSPGVVAVLVVPEPTGVDGPPVPTNADLTAVENHLTGASAPAGVRVAAAAPVYQRVRIEARLAVDPRLDRAGIFQAAGDAVLAYLHPITGGGDGNGWPLGAPLPYVTLVRRLLDVPGVRAVPGLRVLLDGRRVPPCTDAALRPHALPWAERPVLIPVSDPDGGAS